MKTKDSDRGDERLRGVLKEWKMTAGLPPNFQKQVWMRIDRAAAQPRPVRLWRSLSDWITAQLPRPALAAGYIAVLLAVGATAGWTQARHETERITDSLSARYLHSVNPYQAIR